jgi:hypothetical protein
MPFLENIIPIQTEIEKKWRNIIHKGIVSERLLN